MVEGDGGGGDGQAFPTRGCSDLITYRATTQADAGSFTIAINGREKTCQVRGTGEFVTDETHLAVTQTGEHSMELRSLQLPGGAFELKGIRLVMATTEDE